MNGGEHVRVGLGVPSMVLVLVVLCLVLMGILTLVGARADLSQSLHIAQTMHATYEAQAKAQRALSLLDEQMTQRYLASEDRAAYLAACTEIEATKDMPLCWIDEDSAMMTFDAGFERVLTVEIDSEDWERADQKRFSVVRHVLENAQDWEQEDDLLLMGL